MKLPTAACLEALNSLVYFFSEKQKALFLQPVENRHDAGMPDFQDPAVLWDSVWKDSLNIPP